MSALETGLLVTAFAVVLTAIFAYLVRQAGHMQDMRDEITVLKTQVSPLWLQVQNRIASDLHQPHPRYLEMDLLLEKLEALTITPNERVRLEALLVERSTDMHDDISEIQRKEARLMSQVMHIVLLESKGLVTLFLAWLIHHWK